MIQYVHLRVVATIMAIALTASCAQIGQNWPVRSEHDKSDLAYLGLVNTQIYWTDATKKSDPWIYASISGKVGKFIVDTGTSHHLLFSSYFDKTGLPFEKQFNSKQLEVEIGKLRTVSIGFFVIDPIVPLVVDGFDGILSASKLAEFGTTILNFKTSRLWINPDEKRLVNQLPQAVVGDLLNAIRIPWIGRKFGVVYATTSVLDETIIMNVDTGSSRTTVETSVVPPHASRTSGPSMENVDGVVQRSEMIRDAPLTIGTYHTVVKSLLVLDDTAALPDGTKWRGKLGMDVLREFALILPGPGVDQIILTR